MRKVKLYLVLCLYLVSATLNLFICGCSTQTDTDITDNIIMTNITEESPTTQLIEPEPTEKTEPTEPERELDIDFDAESGIMEVFVFGIGKADAILITTENHTVLIDTGENKHGPHIADYLLSRGITEIDYLIITHFHKDHVGGADTIIKNFGVKEVIVPNYGKESRHYARFNAAMLAMRLENSILTEITEFILDNSIFILYPSQLEYREYSDMSDDEYDEDDEIEEENKPNENDFSIVVSVNHGDNYFLFAADATAERLDELLSDENIVNTKYDFLKVPHHGKYNKRSLEFINAVSPKYAVITCSLDKPADKKLISVLEETKADVYLTTNGNIYCISGGNTLITKYIK